MKINRFHLAYYCARGAFKLFLKAKDKVVMPGDMVALTQALNVIGGPAPKRQSKFARLELVCEL